MFDEKSSVWLSIYMPKRICIICLLISSILLCSCGNYNSENSYNNVHDLGEKNSTYKEAVDLYNDKKYSEAIDVFCSMGTETNEELKKEVNEYVIDSNRQRAMQKYDSYMDEGDYSAAALCLAIYDIYDFQDDLSDEYSNVSQKLEQNEASKFYMQTKFVDKKDVIYCATPYAVLDLDLENMNLSGVDWLDALSIVNNYRNDLNVVPHIIIDKENRENSFILEAGRKLEEDEININFNADEAKKYGLIDIFSNEVRSEFAEDVMIFSLYAWLIEGDQIVLTTPSNREIILTEEECRIALETYAMKIAISNNPDILDSLDVTM